MKSRRRSELQREAVAAGEALEEDEVVEAEVLPRHEDETTMMKMTTMTGIVMMTARTEARERYGDAALRRPGRREGRRREVVLRPEEEELLLPRRLLAGHHKRTTVSLEFSSST